MIVSKNNGEAISRPNIGLFRLSLIAIFVGVVTGFGALGFRGLIGFIHNLFFLGRNFICLRCQYSYSGEPLGLPAIDKVTRHRVLVFSETNEDPGIGNAHKRSQRNTGRSVASTPRYVLHVCT